MISCEWLRYILNPDFLNRCHEQFAQWHIDMKMNMENVQTHMTAQINANIKIYSFYSSNVEDI